MQIDLQLPESTFHVVALGFLLMFLHEPAQVISSCSSLLRPGGWLAASIWAGPEHSDIQQLAVGEIEQRRGGSAQVAALDVVMRCREAARALGRCQLAQHRGFAASD